MRRSILSAGLCLVCVCQAMADISFTESLTGFEYSLHENLTASVIKFVPSAYDGYSYRFDRHEIEFPEHVYAEGVLYNVTNIGSNVLPDKNDMTILPQKKAIKIYYITIPGGIQNVDKGAFANAAYITSVTIEKGVRSIGDQAFDGCSLVSINIPNSVTYLGAGAFSNNKYLTNAIIPDDMKSLSSSLFSDCSSLRSVTIGKEVTSIEPFAFLNCTSFTSFTSTIISDSVKSIGRPAFVIPGSVKSIGERAFSGCISITSVIIPSSVTNIAGDAFFENRFTDAYFEWNTREQLSGVYLGLGGMPASCLFHIPRGTERLYGWDPEDAYSKGLQHSIEPHSYITRVNADPTHGSVTCNEDSVPYSQENTLTANLDYGYHLEKWTDAEGNIISDKNPYTFHVEKDNPSITAWFSPNECRLIVLAGEHGRIAPEFRDGIYPYHQPVAIEVIPDEGYHVAKWTNEQGDSIHSSASPPYSFILNGDMTVTAHFAKNSYRVDLSADVNGTIKSGAGVYEYDKEATVEASDKKGGHFSHWADANGNVLSAENPYTFIVKKDIFIQARFEEYAFPMSINGLNYDLTRTAHAAVVNKDNKGYDGNAALVIPDIIAYDGMQFTVVGIADGAFQGNKRIESVTFGYETKEVGEGAFLGCSSLASVSIPSSVKSWKPKTFRECTSLKSVTFEKGVTSIWEEAFFGCSSLVSVTIPYDVARIESRAFSACSKLQEIVLQWPYSDRGVVGDGAFSGVSANCRVYIQKGTEGGYEWRRSGAIWQGVIVASANYVIAARAKEPAMGRVIGGGDREIYYAETTLTAEAAEGYHFTKWTNAEGDTLSDVNPYAFVVVEDMTIWAHFAINTYRVMLSARDHGKIKPIGDSAYPYGTEVTLKAEADTGFYFAKWTSAEGRFLSANNPYTFAVREDADIQAHFALGSNGHQVNVTADNGMIKSGSGVYTHESYASLEVSAHTGYRFVKWTNAAGDILSTDNPCRLLVTGDMDVWAVFEKMNYTLRVSAGANGSADGSGSGLYKDYMKATAVADDGYHFVNWTNAKGDNVSANNPYEFPLINDTELTAVFEEGYRDRVKVTVLSSGGGRALGGGEYDYGTPVKLTAVANSGYFFTGWIRDGLQVSVEDEYEFMPNEGSKESSYLALFTKWLTGNGLLPPVAEAGASYADGLLRLVNLEDCMITVTAATGRKMLQLEAGSNDELYVAALPAGIYILNAAGGKGRYVTKFVVRQ